MTRADVLEDIARSLVWQGLPVRNATAWGDSFDVHLLDGTTYRLEFKRNATPESLWADRGAAVLFFVEHHAKACELRRKLDEANAEDAEIEAHAADRAAWWDRTFGA